MSLNNLLAAPGVRLLARGRAARRRLAPAHGRGEAAHRDLLDRAPLRRGADVLRDAAPEPDAGVDARAVGDDEPAGHPLHGRDRRILPAGRDAAGEGAAADAPEAGPRVRPRASCSRRRTRWTSTTRGSSNTGTWFLGRLQTERDKARVLEGLEGAAAGAAQKFDRARMEQVAGRTRQPRLPAEQRARGRAGRLRDALGDVVSARAADARRRSRR